MEMNIAVFTTFDYSLKTWSNSGTLKRELKFFKLLSEEYGYKFTFITYGDIEDFNLLDAINYFEVIPIYSLIKNSNFKIIRYFKSFYVPFLLKKQMNNIDLIFQNQLMGSWVSIITKFLIKKPLLIRTGYDMLSFAKYEKKSLLKVFLYKLLTLFSLYFCNRFTVTSKTDFHQFKINYKKYITKLVLIPNWVDKYSNNPVENRYTNRILSVGRLEDQKNFELLISEFKNSSTYLQIDIVGEGALQNKLSKLSKDFNVKINFLGSLSNDDLNKLYEKYFFYFSTSKFEGNPKTVLEAMSAGCIVFLSNIPNHSELIQEGNNGFLFNLTKPNLISLWKSEFNNYENLRQISNNAINYTIQNNSIEKIASLFNEDFKKLNTA